MSEERRKVSLASNPSDGLITNFTPFSSDQMIRNLSMKIGEVDSGSARLLCCAAVTRTILLPAGARKTCDNLHSRFS